MPKFEPVEHVYRTGLEHSEGCGGTAFSEGLKSLDVGCPPDFGGPGDVWSPEHLLVSALETCIMTTFMTFCEHRGIEIKSYMSSAVGTALQQGREFKFTEIRIQPKIVVSVEDRDKAWKAAADANERCMVSNTLKCKVMVLPEFKTNEE